MRLFVKIKDASMICVGDEQFPVKGQVADVPDVLGASLISRDEYEVYVEQVKLHKDFVASDKESDKVTALAEAERLAQLAKDEAAALDEANKTEDTPLT